MLHRVPVRMSFDAGGARVRWQASDGLRFTEPFFDDTLARLRRDPDLRGQVRVTDAGAWAATAPRCEPAAIVLHVSRCGSTLVSQMLAALPQHLVVSEAPIFEDILRGGRADPSVTGAMRDAWLAQAVTALAQSQAVPPSRVILKLDCWHVFEIARLRRVFPGVPLVFVYRDPIEVLVSLMRRPSLTIVRDTVTPEEIGITRAERDALTQGEHAAAILGAFFREALRHRAHLVPLAYESLPSSVWIDFAGMTFNDADVALLQRAAARDAKQPSEPFVPDARTKRASANAGLRDACARWTAPFYERWRAAV